MDSAETHQLSDALRMQNVRISQQEEFQEAMTGQVSQLTAQVQSLVAFVQQLTKSATETLTPTSKTSVMQVAPSLGAGIKRAPPERYSGDPGGCKSFIIECSIHFEHSRLVFVRPLKNCIHDFSLLRESESMRYSRAVSGLSPLSFSPRIPRCSEENHQPCVFRPGKGQGAEWGEPRRRLGVRLRDSIPDIGCGEWM